MSSSRNVRTVKGKGGKVARVSKRITRDAPLEDTVQFATLCRYIDEQSGFLLGEKIILKIFILKQFTTLYVSVALNAKENRNVC